MTSPRASSRSPILSSGKLNSTGNISPLNYPSPPNHLFELYTEENVAKGKVPEPPKPIVEGNFSMFGVTITNDDTIIRPLEARGIKRLYPREYDHKRELKKMNSSILVNFLDLLDVIIKCPDTNKREEKCSDIAMLFLQMHHLINELRPYQARETLRVTLHNQRRQRIEIINRLNRQIDKVIEMIVNSTANIPDLPKLTEVLEQLLHFNKPANQNGKETIKETNVKDLSDQSINQINEFDSLMCDIVDQIPQV
ncbi:mediator of RNA polymerase II transcription subunit 7-like [Panonychus citri]|uniref:mediator of RNA polymerase II transcription subunit 7-like n=1 Tax=Panonychus citri TaxID=50023 RepID=UPI0023080390|nr:mediator of RNA polymerase II transcription subunit 7-like [Panonychus citri]